MLVGVFVPFETTTCPDVGHVTEPPPPEPQSDPVPLISPAELTCTHCVSPVIARLVTLLNVPGNPAPKIELIGQATVPLSPPRARSDWLPPSSRSDGCGVGPTAQLKGMPGLPVH